MGLEQKILNRIDEKRDEIIAFARDIYTHAELAYKEYRTAEKFTELIRAQGPAKIETELAVTGVKAYLKQPEFVGGPTVALIGELDALRIPNHPFANTETEAAHACGHHAQLAGVIGAAFALCDKEVKDSLDGNVIFYAVPAEEYGEVAYKNKLTAEGHIRYGGGKSELIRIGAFDDVDISIAHHSDDEYEGVVVGNASSNGFVSKDVRMKGRASHAAAEPERGINALNAATLAQSAIAFQRETFKDEDTVRIHTIITKGGDLVNVIPEEISLESLVRAKTKDAILDANLKYDRAIIGSAEALGAGYEISTLPGYLPELSKVANPAVLDAARMAAPNIEVREMDLDKHTTGSSDIGDLQHIKPVLSFTTNGVKGPFHSASFEIIDEEEAYILTAKIFALSAYNLLKDNAKLAHETEESYTPVFTKETYIEYMESFYENKSKDCI